MDQEEYKNNNIGQGDNNYPNTSGGDSQGSQVSAIDRSNSADSYYSQLKDPRRPRRAKGKGRLLSYCLMSFFIGLWFIFSNGVTTDADSEHWLENIPFTNSTSAHLVENEDVPKVEKKKDRINIIFLGMGGRQHEGGYLTDTIILASLDIPTKKIAMLSIPRDLSVPLSDNEWKKINHVNAFAEMEEADSGGRAVKQALGKLLNIEIDYYVRVDFSGFAKIVDNLGGIKVYVERSFDDPSYPVAGKEDDEDYTSRFQHLHFDQGWNYMDGSLALKYARSRHGNNGEGSDFARGKRQQQVIEAIKRKVTYKEILKPSVLTSMIEDLSYHISTDMGVWEGVRIWKEYKDIESDDIINEVLDNDHDGMLVNMINSAGEYVLTPRTGDFEEIKHFIKYIFTDEKNGYVSKVSLESPTIDVRNGTYIGGMATVNANQLKKMGFDVVNIGNTDKRDYEKSIIYDLTYGEKMNSLKVLKNKLNATVSFGLPNWLIEDLSKDMEESVKEIKQPDFIVILGTD